MSCSIAMAFIQIAIGGGLKVTGYGSTLAKLLLSGRKVTSIKEIVRVAESFEFQMSFPWHTKSTVFQMPRPFLASGFYRKYSFD